MREQTQIEMLRRINAVRARGASDLALIKEYGLDAAATCLAVYGSLAPGEVNHHLLAGLAGTWQRGTTRGHLDRRGWGHHVGFPGFRWDPDEPEVNVQLFRSTDLPLHWSRLDAFEGTDYRRILIPVETRNAILVANIYELLPAKKS